MQADQVIGGADSPARGTASRTDQVIGIGRQAVQGGPAGVSHRPGAINQAIHLDHAHRIQASPLRGTFIRVHAIDDVLEPGHFIEGRGNFLTRPDRVIDQIRCGHFHRCQQNPWVPGQVPQDVYAFAGQVTYRTTYATDKLPGIVESLEWILGQVLWQLDFQSVAKICICLGQLRYIVIDPAEKILDKVGVGIFCQ